MAKDPAVLLYTADFLVGCMTMTDEQVGKYIRLLCLQHQKGHLTEFQMMTVCGTRDEAVFEHFRIDEDGNYFNRRMDLEIQKRAKDAGASRENGKKGGRPKNPQVSGEKPNENPQVIFGEPKNNLTENEDENERESAGDFEDDTPRARREVRHKRSTYGWVLLTDSEYDRLLSDLGEAELKRCIEYVDESAQATGNKNKWKDWNLVVRKCSKQGWGRNQPYAKGGGGNGSPAGHSGGFKPSTGFRQAGDDGGR